MRETGADASVILRCRLLFASKDSILEAVDAGVKLVVCITEGVPTLDMLQVKRYIESSGARLDRPELPRHHHAGRMQDRRRGIHRVAIGIVSRSGTRPTKRCITALGLGQSTQAGIGGDLDSRHQLRRRLQLFQDDPDTEAIIMIGEIGGTAEEEAAEFAKNMVWADPSAISLA